MSEGYKNSFKDPCLINSQTTFLIFTYLLTHEIAILSKAHKPDKFELHNSLKISFANIWAFSLNFVWWESFFESNSPNFVALCEPNLYDSNHSGNFSVGEGGGGGYLLLIWIDYVIMLLISVVLQFMRWRDSFCTSTSKELSQFLFMFWLYFNQSLTSFSFIAHILHFCPRFLMLLHLTQMGFPWSIYLLMRFVFIGFCPSQGLANLFWWYW